MNTILVQLSDAHVCAAGVRLYDRIDTSGMLQAAVTAVCSLSPRPDAVLVSGDLVESGAAAQYAQFADIIKRLPMPVYLLPGNHDDREQLRRSFPEHTYLGAEGFVQYTARIGGLRLIALDTVVPGKPYGELCDARMSWLAEQLERHCNETVVIAMHHPPFETLIRHMDDMGLAQGAPELEKLVSSYPNVARILCGHVHRAIHARFAGTIASVCPSTAHQISADLAPDAQATWSFEPPGFHIHACSPEGRLVTHLASSSQYAGPYPFE